MNAREQLATFTVESIPTLDVAVAGALELFAETTLPDIPRTYHYPLVVGSGNAYATGTILYANHAATFATESTLARTLAHYDTIDGAVLISASGGKHAVGIAERLKTRGIETTLLTNNPTPPAGQYVSADRTFIFPKNREPYTYNTSTYFGMVFAMTHESAAAITDHIAASITPALDRDLSEYPAYTMIVPAVFAPVVPMLRTKFDELFGPFVAGRIFTEEEIKHAKTVVSGKRECFIGLGVSNDWYGVPENRITLPLPEDADFGAVLSIGYHAIGRIQAAHPPYFADNIATYAERASAMFQTSITPIVE